MTKTEVLAAIKQLVAKPDLQAVVNALVSWVQSKFVNAKDYTDAKIAEVVEQVQAVYRPSGDITPEELIPALLTKVNLGKVFNLTQGFITTDDWKEGRGKVVREGSDVGIVEVSTVTYAVSEDTSVDADKTYYSDNKGTPVENSSEGYGEKNPSTEGWYEQTVDVAYKFNALAGVVDTSDFLTADDFDTIGSTEAAVIVAAAISTAEEA